MPLHVKITEEEIADREGIVITGIREIGGTDGRTGRSGHMRTEIGEI
jgi:hypothetical protein